MIVTLAAGRDLTRAEMIDILVTAGYRGRSATGRMRSSHPLFGRTGPDRYRMIGDGQLGRLGLADNQHPQVGAGVRV
jgi:hypothetical protein